MATLTIPSKEAGTFVEIDGLRTFYVKAGAGPAIVLIHGGAPGACALVNYGPVIEPLAAKGFTVYAYDQPGFGLTDNPNDYSQEAAVAHAKAFVEAMDLDRYHVVGNSMGVYVAARLALEDAKVAKLVAVAGGSLARNDSAETAAVSKQHGQDLAAYTPSLENMRSMLHGTLYKRELVTDELVRLRYEMSIGKNFEAQQARRKAPRAHPIVDALSHLNKPTLVIWGRNDRGNPVERAYRAFEAIPGAELHAFNECAHWPMWDHSERFTTLVAGFLADGSGV
jgi:2-hydroxy-6-oxonona-2,4-dienedioate hydrolase